MGVGNVYTMFSLDLSSPIAATFSRLANLGATPNLSIGKAFPAGLPYPMFATLRGGAPRVQFTTSMIDTLFDVCLASSGNGYSADLSGGTNTFSFEKVLAYGVRDPTVSVHPQLVVSDPMLYWSNISVAHGGVAVATVALAVAFDGTNSPLAYSAVTLSGTQTATEEFGLGQVKINGTALDGVRSVSIDSGVELVEIGDESDIWPTLVAVRRCAPMVSVEMLDLSYLGTVGLSAAGAGVVLNGSTGIEIYFRRRDHGGANATGAVHPKITIANGTVHPADFGASVGSGGRLGISVTAVTSTATTPPMLVAVGATHP